MPRPRKYDNQTDYKKEFNKLAYDRIEITVPKGQKATVEAAAKEAGESVNQYTQKALLGRMRLSEWPTIEEKQEE